MFSLNITMSSRKYYNLLSGTGTGIGLVGYYMNMNHMNMSLKAGNLITGTNKKELPRPGIEPGTFRSTV